MSLMTNNFIVNTRGLCYKTLRCLILRKTDIFLSKLVSFRLPVKIVLLLRVILPSVILASVILLTVLLLSVILLSFILLCTILASAILASAILPSAKLPCARAWVSTLAYYVICISRICKAVVSNNKFKNVM
jgi:hypothetical protein